MRPRPHRGKAETLSRQAVLALLLDGNTVAARRVAAAVSPALADSVRIHVVIGPTTAQRVLLPRLWAEYERSWVVPPLEDDEPIVVIEPTPDREPALRPQPRVLTEFPECAVGSSPRVPLSQVASGYAEAVSAAQTSFRAAGVRVGPDAPALLLPPDAAYWAANLLGPLMRHAPKRASAPAPPELVNTLRAWLEDPRQAGNRLYVHRNTMGRRLVHIQHLLQVNLSELASRAQLTLALAHFDSAWFDSPPALKSVSFGELLESPPVRDWGAERIRTLANAGASRAVQTVRTWLAHGARLSPTADALGISATALRKRFARIEVALGNQDFRRPMTQYGWWLAFAAHTPN